MANIYCISCFKGLIKYLELARFKVYTWLYILVKKIYSGGKYILRLMFWASNKVFPTG